MIPKKRKILIVEDNGAFSNILRIRLEANGYQTVLAQNGLEGLALARQTQPDLILLDLMLPQIDGHKVCRLLKFDKKFQNVPIIILTSRDLDDDAELAKKNGADGFLVKTIHPNVMLDVIERLLAAKDKIRQETADDVCGMEGKAR